MSDRLLVSTRKGLFFVERDGGRWHVARHRFLGDNVTLALADRRDGSVYAAMNLGHFGVKLRRSVDDGGTFDDIGAPAYPEGETVATGDGKPPQPAARKETPRVARRSRNFMGRARWEADA